jgi:hypothetical protein
MAADGGTHGERPESWRISGSVAMALQNESRRASGAVEAAMVGRAQTFRANLRRRGELIRTHLRCQRIYPNLSWHV